MDLEAHARTLRAHAIPTCPLCDGEGIETIERPLGSLNLCNANAGTLLALLGLQIAPAGKVSMPDARRALMRATSSFDRLAPCLTRDAASVYGPPMYRSDGAVELRPIRTRFAALSVEDLRVRLSMFAEIVYDAIDAGADAITWD